MRQWLGGARSFMGMSCGTATQRSAGRRGRQLRGSMLNPDVKNCLDRLATMPLKRIDAGGVAGLCVTSLPWPATPAAALSLGGRPTHVQQLGQWPNAPANSPRRLLMVADTGGEAPSTLSVTGPALMEGSPPTAEAEVFEH